MSNPELIRHLAEYIDPVAPDVTGARLYDMFSRDPELLCVPVVVEDRPIGLVTRYEFMLKLADRFGRALYEKRAITQAMDDAPLVIDANVMLDDLATLILTRKPGAIMSGFLVTEDGRYLGVGTALSMLRMRVNQSEERARILDLARREAEEASRSKTEFLANMSHELRTPLNAIIGFSKILTQGMFGALGNERYVQYARDIHASGQHLLQVIGHILDLSKIEAGKMELATTDVEAALLVHEAMRITESAAKAAGIALVIEAPESVGTVPGDETKLRQVLINLLSNAIKFTPKGGYVTVRIEPAADAGVRIVVRDTGIGMSEEEVRVAIEPFRQIESHLNKRYAGTGLGLPLSKAMIELHGGRFELVSAKGRGTEVALTLPGSARIPSRMTS